MCHHEHDVRNKNVKCVSVEVSEGNKEHVTIY